LALVCGVCIWVIWRTKTATALEKTHPAYLGMEAGSVKGACVAYNDFSFYFEPLLLHTIATFAFGVNS
jgi:hypothetical protein